MTQRPGDPSGGVFGEADALLQAGVCEVMRLYTSLRSVFIVFLLRFEFFSRYRDEVKGVSAARTRQGRRSRSSSTLDREYRRNKRRYEGRG